MPVQVRPAVPEAASGDNRPFWAIFLCKENSPQKGTMPRLYSLPGELSSAGFYCSPFPPFSFAFIKNTKAAKPPLSAPTGAADDTDVPSRNAIIIANIAPIAAEAATTTANAVTMMIRGPIFTTLTSLREVPYS